MSLLDVGSRCYACTLVDFLPLRCPACAHTFCREHIQGHGCSDAPTQAAGPSRKRVRGTCAFAPCEEETLESVGGLERGEQGERLQTGEGLDGGDIAREVRCVCGGAFCIKHRSQEAHECTAPRALSARQDAATARRALAQEVLKQHFPEQAGRERLRMPKQVDRTRTGSPPRAAPTAAAGVSEPAPESTSPAPATNTASCPAPTTPATAIPPAAPTVNDKIYKMHQTKTRSLARALDPKVAREECAAVEFVLDEGGARVRSWIADAGKGKYAPTAVGAALGAGKPERLWVPHVMPGGKLFDTLVARGKMSRGGAPLSILVISLRPDAPRAASPLDLARPAGDQVSSGDVLVLVRGWE